MQRDGANMIDSFVGSKVHTTRLRSGLALVELAAAAGLTASKLDDCEQGLVRFSPRELLSISKTLGVPFSCFFPRHEEILRLSIHSSEKRAALSGGPPIN